MEQANVSCVDWAVRGRPIAGERVSGDLHVFDDQGDRCVLGVIDGLGHGPSAAEAANAAAAGARDARGDLATIFASCEASARRTRGVAVSLAILETSGALTWGGIGNVEAIVVKAAGRDSLTLRGGVVGEGTTRPRIASVHLVVGDVLCFFSDGIRTEAVNGVARLDPVATIADTLLERFAKSGDDAIVLVARFTGSVS